MTNGGASTLRVRPLRPAGFRCVFGGTCVVSNLCPAKFACIGCSGNAPDPERRYQMETKLTWGREQIAWAHWEHLPAEERQMKRVVQGCDLLLEEMTLIERARADQRQKVYPTGAGPCEEAKIRAGWNR